MAPTPLAIQYLSSPDMHPLLVTAPRIFSETAPHRSQPVWFWRTHHGQTGCPKAESWPISTLHPGTTVWSQARYTLRQSWDLCWNSSEVDSLSWGGRISALIMRWAEWCRCCPVDRDCPRMKPQQERGAPNPVERAGPKARPPRHWSVIYSLEKKFHCGL